MKNTLFILFIVLSACGGSLSDEQRKKIREDMKQHQIVRISAAEITEAAFGEGRRIMSIINKGRNSSTQDSLATAQKVKVRWIIPGSTTALEVEKQIIEAYLISSVNGGMEDNIQRLGTDSLLYTKPVTEELPDGSENVKGMWSIRLSKKQLILGMSR